jgi:hypothetical protein
MANYRSVYSVRLHPRSSQEPLSTVSGHHVRIEHGTRDPIRAYGARRSALYALKTRQAHRVTRTKFAYPYGCHILPLLSVRM